VSPDEKAYARHRLGIGREAFAEAQSLFEGGHTRGVVSRLYYAVFHAVEALLYVDERPQRRHKTLQAVFNGDYANKGLVSPEAKTLFNDLYKARLLADYAEDYDVTREQLATWLDATPAFINEIAALVRARGVEEA